MLLLLRSTITSSIVEVLNPIANDRYNGKQMQQLLLSKLWIHLRPYTMCPIISNLIRKASIFSILIAYAGNVGRSHEVFTKDPNKETHFGAKPSPWNAHKNLNY